MKYTTIPHTDLRVSKICLGTMTWGNQNTPAEGFDQMDYALEKGLNFFDTAELYPVPATAETYAETERIMGNWKAHQRGSARQHRRAAVRRVPVVASMALVMRVHGRRSSHRRRLHRLGGLLLRRSSVVQRHRIAIIVQAEPVAVQPNRPAQGEQQAHRHEPQGP